MRKILAGVTTAAIVVLAACSSASQGVDSSIPSAGANPNRAGSEFTRIGVPIQDLRSQEILQDLRGVSPDAKKKLPDDLFVDDRGLNAVEILENGTWHNDGSISNGIDAPDGNWVDTKGNLYVADFTGANVQEYKPGATSPTFTYSAGMTDPVVVTTDSHGKVYEGDYIGSYVNEYTQGSNGVLHNCAPGGMVEAVAVDAAGDVFVAYNLNSTAKIIKYTGGLKGCSGTVLGVTLKFAGSMVLDAHSDIIVCDQGARTVDVLDPPYRHISRKLGSGWSDPFHVTINKKNNQAYVVDFNNANVQVLAYPSGKNQATLNSANGLSVPDGAVDGSNFNP